MRFGAAATCAGIVLLAAVAGDLFLASLTWQGAAVGAPIASLDHRPRPLVIRLPEAQARLSHFEPNLLVYEVSARRPARIVLPLRYGPREAEWEVDPLPAFSHEGRVAIEAPVGEVEVVLRYRPPWLRTGLGVSAATALLLLAAARLRRGARRSVG